MREIVSMVTKIKKNSELTSTYIQTFKKKRKISNNFVNLF